jgi:GNAT superfamily N-acetyltransferase
VAWWDRRDTSLLCAGLSQAARKFGLDAAAVLPEIDPGAERVGCGDAVAPHYAVEYLPLDDDPTLCELARIEVGRPLRRKGIATCLYFAFEDWLRAMGCAGVAATGTGPAALLNANVGFDFDPPGIPSDLVADLQLPVRHGLRYPFEVARYRKEHLDGRDLLMRRSFTGKRIFNDDPTLEAVSRERRASC